MKPSYINTEMRTLSWTLTLIKKGYEPDFYGFGTEFSEPFADVGLDYYNVNKWTGDVWNVVGSVCHRVSSELMQNLQEKIRKHASWQYPGYNILRAKQPTVWNSEGYSRISLNNKPA